MFPQYHGIDALDQRSLEGKFTWMQVGNKGYLPVITRNEVNGSITKFVSVKMVEKGFLGQFMKNLPYEVMSNISNIYSYKVTEAEAKLLFEINARHCDNNFGKNETFVRDFLVQSDEFLNFYSFLTLCNDKMVLKKSNEHDKCGFLRIDGKSDVPYVVFDNIKYMPLFYFEGELGSIARKEIESWDWAYLKFCCKVQGVKDQMLPKKSCPVISVKDLKTFLPPGTTFQEYWPSMDYVNKLFSKKTTQSGSWTRLSMNYGDKFIGKLTKLRDFPVQPTGDHPYKAEKALIDKKKINGVNTKPYQYKDLLVALPHFVEQFFPKFSERQIGDVLLDAGILLYSGNSGHKDVLRCQGWEDKYDDLPLVTVKDLVNNLQQIKNCLDTNQVKRLRGN